MSLLPPLTAADLASRMRRLIPFGWVNTTAPYVDAVLGGIADALASTYDFMRYALPQLRITAATGFWLDLIALDFFGLRIRRRVGETDDQFRLRIKRELLRERVTRSGMVQALTDLTGMAPIIFEPWNVSDAGGYNTGYTAYNAAGGYGSLDLPGQVFIDIKRPASQPIPLVGGYGPQTNGGFNTGGVAYVDLAQAGNVVSEQEILDTINMTKPAGVICWVRFI